jgi:single-stranded DNA-binding protein
MNAQKGQSQGNPHRVNFWGFIFRILKEFLKPGELN